MTNPTIKLSLASYNELAGELEKLGIKPSERGTIELAKSTLLVPPVDYRSATIRRDVLSSIVRLDWSTNNPNNFRENCEMMYQWVLNGMPPKAGE